MSVAALCLAFWPGAASAHPHIFIDAGLRLVVEEGRVTAVEVTWLYDELYSLLLMEDHGLDQDFDLVLTDAEVNRLIGFDLDWTHGFEGGLVLRRGDAVLELGPPEPVALSLEAPGQIRTTHRRAVIDPGGGPGGGSVLEAQVFDAEFYVAFEMTGEMIIDGATCDTELVRADLDGAYAALDEALADIGGAVAEEDNFPEVGALFADRLVVTCAG